MNMIRSIIMMRVFADGVDVSIKINADRLNLWDPMLFTAKINVEIIVTLRAMFSIETNVDRLNLWGAMLLITEIDVITKLLNIVSEVESDVRSILLADLLLMKNCWYSLLRIWLWSLFLKSNIFSQWLQENLSHVIIWL